ncbi:TonB-dependent siderophore receptor [Dyella sp.]|uniref:TonB-dependent siderophore receptor n=1 Tax=Dyella sp. TaxID=1869338 RepID=UPI002B47AB60|nr:TonB-dependent receptor [Dyella sp.]HKT27766.1 TonB-dependent receptor [Dyella sp.]
MHPLSTFRRNTLTVAIALMCTASFQATAGTTDTSAPQATSSTPSNAQTGSSDASSQAKDKKQNSVNLQQVVVTGSPLPSTEMNSSISVSTVDGGQIQSSGVQNAADLLRTIPGIRSESSGGAGNANISVRGLPVASGGSKFVQFQVDGMPVLEFGDTAFATPDTFLRTDYNIDHVEAVRGGSSSIFASNAPGAIINFITKDGSTQGGDIGLTVGLGKYDDQRLDFDYGGPLSTSTRYHFGGFVQHGNGQKNTDYTSSSGGQLMGNITHDIDGGFLRLNLQFTDTYDPVYLPVPVMITGNNSDPHVSSIPGFNVQSGVLQSPYFTNDTALNAQGQTIHTNIRDGYHTRVNAIGGEGKFSLGDDWTLHEQFRLAENYGAFTGPYPTNVESAQTLADSIGGAGSYLTYATGPNAGKRVTSPATLGGNGLASETALFNVSLPNMDNFTNNISLSRTFDTDVGKGTLQFGYYHSQQNVVQDWHWNMYLQTVQSQDSALLNVYSASGKLMTENGLVAYGTPGFCGSCNRYYDAKYMMDAPFVSMTWETGPWRFDGGVRFDRINGSGYYVGATQTAAVDVNRDGVLSVPEQSVPVYGGATSPINYSKSHLEYSFGANYTIDSNLALFLRASSGARFNSDRLLFGGGILADGSVPQGIGVNVVKQYEGGVKWNTAHTSLFVTGFMANTQEQNEDVTSTIEPFISRHYHARGVEFEGSVNYGHFSLAGGMTYTHSRIVSDAITPADVGNVPQRQANWVYQFSPSYSWRAFNFGATLIGTTKSYASDPNGLVMPGYTQVNTYVSYDINDRMTASLSVNNLFNAIGLTEVDSSPETVTSNGINTARSILGRTIYLNWQYHL